MAKNLLHENMMIISNMFNIKIIKVEEAKIFVLRIFRSATILLIAKIRSLQLSAIVPNGQLAGRLNGFMSKLMRKRRSWFKAH